jgi:hypothetical protein
VISECLTRTTGVLLRREGAVFSDQEEINQFHSRTLADSLLLKLKNFLYSQSSGFSLNSETQPSSAEQEALPLKRGGASSTPLSHWRLCIFVSMVSYNCHFQEESS